MPLGRRCIGTGTIAPSGQAGRVDFTHRRAESDLHPPFLLERAQAETARQTLTENNRQLQAVAHCLRLTLTILELWGGFEGGFLGSGGHQHEQAHRAGAKLETRK